MSNTDNYHIDDYYSEEAQQHHDEYYSEKEHHQDNEEEQYLFWSNEALKLVLEDAAKRRHVMSLIHD